MARYKSGQYKEFYTDGSAARQIELKPHKGLPDQPKRPKQKKILIRVDFLALSGILVAAVMLVLMIVGAGNLMESTREVARMEEYVSQLETENEKLDTAYHAGFDPEQIRERALEMGMVPAEELPVVTIQISGNDAVEEPQNIWASVWSFLTDLFA